VWLQLIPSILELAAISSAFKYHPASLHFSNSTEDFCTQIHQKQQEEH
jgi:hypothetical protein